MFSHLYWMNPQENLFGELKEAAALEKSFGISFFFFALLIFDINALHGHDNQSLFLHPNARHITSSPQSQMGGKAVPMMDGQIMRPTIHSFLDIVCKGIGSPKREDGGEPQETLAAPIFLFFLFLQKMNGFQTPLIAILNYPTLPYPFVMPSDVQVYLTRRM